MKLDIVDKIITNHLFTFVLDLLELYIHRYTYNLEMECPLCRTASTFVHNPEGFNMCYYCPWNWTFDNNWECETIWKSQYENSNLCMNINHKYTWFGQTNPNIHCNSQEIDKRKEEIKDWIRKIIEYIKENREYKTDEQISSCILSHIENRIQRTEEPYKVNNLANVWVIDAVKNPIWKDNCTSEVAREL